MADDAAPDLNTAEGFMASIGKDLGIDIQVGDGKDAPAPAAVAAPEPGQSALAASLLAQGITDDGSGGDNADADKTADDATAKPDDDAFDYKKGYEELRTLTGRMSNELGELRKGAAPEDDLTDQTPDPVLSVPMTDEVSDALDEAIQRDGGEKVAYWALVQRPDLYEHVLDLWGDSGLPGASRRAAAFDLRYVNALAAEEERVAQESEKQFQSSLGASLDEKVAELAPSFGLTPGDAALDAALAEIVADQPKSVQALVVSKDEVERTKGVQIILALAVAKGVTPAPADADADKDGLTKAMEHAKGAAAVGGGGLRPAPAPAKSGGEPGDEPDILARLTEHMLKAPSTSVADGLTIGGKPLNG